MASSWQDSKQCLYLDRNTESSQTILADYWKSQAKKFCDFCKCWIADNKPSIEFHEKGKRHQENVKQRITDIRKKSTKEFKAKEKLDDDMRKMEEAALKAYQKDIAVNPDMSSTSFEMPELPAQKPNPVRLPPAPKSGPRQPYKRQSKPFTPDLQVANTNDDTSTVKKEDSREIPDTVVKSETSAKETVKQEIDQSRQWYESLSDEGYSYYWNIQTNASVWEPPEEGYVSLSEQQAELLESESKKDESEEAKDNTKVKQESKSDEDEEDTSSSSSDEEEKPSEPEDEKPSEPEDEKPLEPEDEKPSESEEDSRPSAVDVPNARPLMGPMPRTDPYGGWQTIVKVEPKKIDLQLPQRQIVELQVPTLTREPRMTFKEKTVKSLAGVNEIASFKKRKLASGTHKRNMRQRLDDD